MSRQGVEYPSWATFSSNVMADSSSPTRAFTERLAFSHGLLIGQACLTILMIDQKQGAAAAAGVGKLKFGGTFVYNGHAQDDWLIRSGD
jgi:hypothetical protein